MSVRVLVTGLIVRSYILTQNAKIAAGTLSGIPINLKVLGVGDGLTVSLTTTPSYCWLLMIRRTHCRNTQVIFSMQALTRT